MVGDDGRPRQNRARSAPGGRKRQLWSQRHRDSAAPAHEADTPFAARFRESERSAHVTGRDGPPEVARARDASGKPNAKFSLAAAGGLFGLCKPIATRRAARPKAKVDDQARDRSKCFYPKRDSGRAPRKRSKHGTRIE